jgi:hypothetical protein
MGHVVQFVSKSELERARLIREARAIYDSIFPPADSVGEQQDKGPVSHPLVPQMSVTDGGLLR